jgi:hypothetical protein
MNQLEELQRDYENLQKHYFELERKKEGWNYTGLFAWFILASGRRRSSYLIAAAVSH